MLAQDRTNSKRNILAVVDVSAFTSMSETAVEILLEIVGEEALFRVGNHVAYTKTNQITTSKTLVSLTMGSTWHEMKRVRIWRAELDPKWEHTKDNILSKRRTFEAMEHHYKNPSPH